MLPRFSDARERGIRNSKTDLESSLRNSACAQKFCSYIGHSKSVANYDDC